MRLSHTLACGTSARHSTPTALFTQSLARWNVPLGSRTTTPRKQSWTNSLAQSFTPRQDAALIAEMLSLPNDGRYPTLEIAAQQRRQKTLEALTAQLEALSRSNPVLMIFEDVHWIDPTSLEALGRTVARIRTLSALLIVTYRPEFAPPWIGQPHVTALTINRLGDWEIAIGLL